MTKERNQERNTAGIFENVRYMHNIIMNLHEIETFKLIIINVTRVTVRTKCLRYMKCHIIRLEFTFKFGIKHANQRKIVTSATNDRCLNFEVYKNLLGFISFLWCIKRKSSSNNALESKKK